MFTTHIEASIETSKVAAYPGYHDNATAVSLVKLVDPLWEGWFMSDSLLLVSNATDDEEKDFGRIRTDDLGPDSVRENVKDGYHFPVSDRTHKIALSATLRATYGVKNDQGVVVAEYTASRQVRTLNSIKLDVKVVDVGPGTTAVRDVTVPSDIKYAQEVFAQVGLAIQYNTPRIIARPANVILTDGLDTYTNVDGGRIGLKQEERNLLDAERIAPDEFGHDVIDIYYVNMLTRADARGCAYWSTGLATDMYANCVVISSARRTPLTLAHEIGHIVLDTGNHVWNREDVVPPGHLRTRLMMSGFHAIEDPMRSVFDSRRLTAVESATIYSSDQPNVLFPPPG